MSLKRRRKSEEASWPAGSEGFRVLVETGDDAQAWADERILGKAGFVSLSCHGPARIAEGRCPWAHGEACALVEGADLVVYGLSLSKEEERAVLAAHRARRPGLPVVLEATEHDRADNADLIEGCRVVGLTDSGARLVEAVVTAAKERTDQEGER